MYVRIGYTRKDRFEKEHKYEKRFYCAREVDITKMFCGVEYLSEEEGLTKDYYSINTIEYIKVFSDDVKGHEEIKRNETDLCN